MNEELQAIMVQWRAEGWEAIRRLDRKLSKKFEAWFHDGTMEGLDFSGLDIQGLNFEEAQLRNVNLADRSLDFRDCRQVNVEGADLSNSTLIYAELVQANLNHVDLHDAALVAANLENADLNKANLRGVNLRLAQNITEAQLSQAYAMRFALMPNGDIYDGRFKLVGDIQEAAELGVDLDDPEQFKNFYREQKSENEIADAIALLREKGRFLDDKTWRNIHIWIHDGQLEGHDLNGVDLGGILGLGRNAKLRNTNLSNANLSGSYMRGADLENANLSNARMVRTEFGPANLRNANLSGAVLASAIIGPVEFDHANLRGVNLKSARFVSDERLAKADAMRWAILPNGEIYDGRFNLEGDLKEAAELGIDLDDPEQFKNFYQPAAPNQAEEC